MAILRSAGRSSTLNIAACLCKLPQMPANGNVPEAETRPQPNSGPLRAPLVRCDVEIFIVSALILYLELMLIRWIGTEIRIFAYLGNLILVVCFFGVGLGCYWSRRPAYFGRMGLNLFLLVTLVANPLHWEALEFRFVTYLFNGPEDAPIWQEMVGASGLDFVAGIILIGILLYLLALIFVPLGQILGQSMQDAPQVIRAYSTNIAGSLAGAWLL